MADFAGALSSLVSSSELFEPKLASSSSDNDPSPSENETVDGDSDSESSAYKSSGDRLSG